MKPWKWALAVAGLATAIIGGKIIGENADKNSALREQRRDDAHAEAAASLRRRIGSEPVGAGEQTNTLDSRLVNPPGTVWWSGGGGANFDPYFYIFYGNGQMIRVGGDTNAGVWSVNNGLLIENLTGIGVFTGAYSVKSAAGGKWLLFLGTDDGLELCYPKIQNSCSDDSNNSIIKSIQDIGVQFE